MADTKQTPRDEPEPAATEADTAPDAAPEDAAPAAPADDAGDGSPGDGSSADETAVNETAADEAPSKPSGDDDADTDSSDDDTVDDDAPDDEADDVPAKDEADDESDVESDIDPTDAGPDADEAKTETEAKPKTDTPATIGNPDETPAGPYPTRVGWVVAAFLFFWPLAIPALVQSMRTAEANGTGNARRAKKASVRTLDFALGAVTLGVLGIVGLAIGVAAAPTYASSLPPGLVAAARSFVPPALAGPLGITLPDDGAPLAAPTPPLTPTEEPYPTPVTELPPDPFPETLPDGSDPEAIPDAGDPEATDEPTPASDTTATAGAEIPDLQVGDCIDTSATSGQTTLYRIPVVACTTAHGGEIYAETTAPDSLAEDGSTPTQQALWDAADAYCYPQFARFVGLRWARSELLYWPIAPSEASWAEGDRRILCVVESEQPVTGSLSGAER